MDGLSAAASVIAVVQIAQSVGGFLKELYRDVRDARAEIERLYDSVASLEIIAKELDNLLKRRGVDILNASLLEDPNGPLKQALSELKTVKDKLDVQVVDGSRFEKMKLSARHSVKRSLGWHFKKDEVLAVAARLEKHVSTLMMNTTVNTLSIQFQHSDILQDIRKDVAAAQNDVHRQRLIEWLAKSVPDPSIEHNNALKKHEETTGSWLIEGDVLKTWLEAPNSCLWVHGNAGVGKSVLCSAVIRDIQKQCSNEPNAAVVYWYFTFRDSITQKIDQCLRSIITNLCSKRPDTPRELQEAYTNANNGQLSPSTACLMTILSAVMDGFENVYIFLDALDECPRSGQAQERERRELLEAIDEIHSWRKDCLHLFLTSRNERDIEESLDELSGSQVNFKAIGVQGSHVEEDINKYIQLKLNSRPFRGWKPDLKEEVGRKLGSQAEGMFRLVALQLDILLDSASPAAIRKALDMLPKTLDSFYDRALLDIREPHRRLAATALQWLATSARPLSLSELAEAIVIRPGDDPSFNPDERLMDEFQILEFIPAGLVRKVFRKHPPTDGRWLPHDKEVAFIEFAHFSVLEYLKASRMDTKLQAAYQVQEKAAHTMIAASCFSYMLYVGKQEQALTAEMLNFLKDNSGSGQMYISDQQRYIRNGLCHQLDERYVLSAYANRAWQYHMSRLELIDASKFSLGDSFFLDSCTKASVFPPLFPESFDKLAVEFLDITGNSWLVWCCVTLVLERTPRLASPLHAASMGNNLRAVQLLLSTQADVNEIGGFRGSPLGAAIHSGSIEAVKLILEAGADVNLVMRRNGHRTALIAACSVGSFDIVKLLLDSGANVNDFFNCPIHSTALVAACCNGSLEIVRCLVEAGANVNRTTENHFIYGTALGASCFYGHPEVVKFLIDSGADVNVPPHPHLYGTALSAACYGISKKTLDIVRLLLDAGADLKITRGKSYGIALFAACSMSHPGVVRLLLESGATVKGDTAALGRAVWSREIGDITLLLEYGASIGSKEDPYSPYQVAFKRYRAACNSEQNESNTKTMYKTILDIFDSRLEEQGGGNAKGSSADPSQTISHAEVTGTTSREEGAASLPVHERKD